MEKDDQPTGDFKDFNAKKGLEGYDPTMDSELLRRHYSPSYSQKEWDEYNEAKSQCETWQEWLKKRNSKHEEMARKWYDAYEISNKSK